MHLCGRHLPLSIPIYPYISVSIPIYPYLSLLAALGAPGKRAAKPTPTSHRLTNPTQPVIASLGRRASSCVARSPTKRAVTGRSELSSRSAAGRISPAAAVARGSVACGADAAQLGLGGAPRLPSIPRMALGAI